MQELVSRGADLAAIDSHGRTPAQLFRDRHGRMPAMMETFNRAFPETVRQ